jgi:hypothetical protein
LIYGQQDEMFVLMCVLRLKKVNTDVVISHSSPKELKSFDEILKIFHTFEITDWSLFG